jgi:hypothetical protein
VEFCANYCENQPKTELLCAKQRRTFHHEKLDYFKSKVLSMFSDNSKPGFVLGRKFVLSRAEDEVSFREFWQSLIWFSYRSDFPSIEPTLYSSDVGWGCTLRTAQMLLANAFLHHFVGHGTPTIFISLEHQICIVVFCHSLTNSSCVSRSKYSDWISKSHHQSILESRLKVRQLTGPLRKKTGVGPSRPQFLPPKKK